MDAGGMGLRDYISKLDQGTLDYGWEVHDLKFYADRECRRQIKIDANLGAFDETLEAERAKGYNSPVDQGLGNRYIADERFTTQRAGDLTLFEKHLPKFALDSSEFTSWRSALIRENVPSQPCEATPQGCERAARNEAIARAQAAFAAAAEGDSEALAEIA